ncbi:MAG: VCBS repeat-containing protein [Planctomycetota bacterium]
MDIPIRVIDADSDLVSIRIEFNSEVLNGSGIGPWFPARPAGTPASQTLTPQFGIVNVRASASGSDLIFVWDSAFDLTGLERDVLLRFTVRDEAGDESRTVVTAPFRVDNNSAPLSVLNEGNFVLNPDVRRGIPIQFQVIDEESDVVRALFQYAREGQAFPTLSDDATELIDLLESPSRRSERIASQICTEIPATFSGFVGPPLPGMPNNSVRLPELASESAGLFGYVTEGRTLSILRDSLIPAATQWSSSPLTNPAGVIPSSRPTAAFFLDQGGPGWRVQEIDLATGDVLRMVASGPGSPRAMALYPPRAYSGPSGEDGDATLFVATDSELSGFTFPAGDPTGTVNHSMVGSPRFVAATGHETVLATGDGGLVQVSMSTGIQSTLIPASQLEDPQGIAFNSDTPDQVLVCERGADRVVSIDLRRLDSVPIAAAVASTDLPQLGSVAFPRPGALALERSGERLLVMCDLGAGASSLRALDWNRPITGEVDVGEGPFVFEITNQLADPSGDLAAGVDDLRISLQPATGLVAVGGGVQQERRLSGQSSYQPRGQLVTVEEAFDPMPATGSPWRIGLRVGTASSSSPSGSTNVFVWDSSDVDGGGRVRVRLIPIDSDAGAPITGSNLRDTYWDLEVESRSYATQSSSPVGLAMEDLDGDGDLDVVVSSTSGSAFEIFFQSSPGVLTSSPTVLSHPAISARSATVLADFDGDGDLDIAGANDATSNVTIFFQVSPGQFDPSPLIIANPALLNPELIAAADFDGDGDMDLVTDSNDFPPSLTVFLQSNPGQFATPPIILDPGVSFYSDLIADDLDGDGNADIAVALSTSDALAVLYQTAPGAFSSSPTTLANAGLDSPVALTSGDFNCDGRRDLACAYRAVNSVIGVFLQGPSGVFDSAPSIMEVPRISNTNAIEAGDLDGDGDLDLVVTGFGPPQVFLQTAPGEFSDSAFEIDDPNIPGASDVLVGDLDGMGGTDLLLGQSSGELRVVRQSYPGEFSSTSAQVDVSDTVDLQDIAVADLDGDGDLDFVTAHLSSNNLAIVKQEAPGQFSSQPTFLTDPSAGAPISVIATDLDGDGDIDVVSANRDTDNLAVFFQETPGQFSSTPISLSSPGLSDPRAVTAADFDRDGDLDLASANFASDNIAIFRQSSPGTFDPTPTLLSDPRFSGPLCLASGDFDGDGGTDIACGNRSESLAVFLQGSQGQFSAAPGILEGPSVFAVRSIGVGDLDDDGDLDLVSTNVTTGSDSRGFAIRSVTAFFQDSPGSFSSPGIEIHAPSAYCAYSLSVADVDHDGDLDVVTTERLFEAGFSRVATILQTSPGNFDSRAPIRAELKNVLPSNSLVTDMDGDGELDVIVRGGGNTISIMYGGR